MHTDYFALLGVTRTATADEIRAAYRRLAQRLHPDVSDEPAAEERFKQITRAYQVLRDPDQRVRYELETMERELEVRVREFNSQPPVIEPTRPGDAEGASLPPANWEGDFADRMHGADAERPRGLFKRLARRRGERHDGEAAPIVGDDYEVIAEITLEEAVRGGLVTLGFTVPERGHNGAAREIERTAEIRVPKLAFEGQRLRLKGQGGPGRGGGRDGDLHVEVAYKHHPLFRVRDNHEVWFYLPIAPWEAVLGAIVEMPTLERPFRVHVPAGSTSGQTFRLPGRGLPKAGGGRTDLLACLRVLTPDTPTEQERALYLQLSRVSRFNPRRGLT